MAIHSPGNRIPLAGDGGTVTVSTPLLNLTQTWNAGGVTFTGALVNITDTASASASLLMDLQVASASKFSVDKFGSVVAAGVFASLNNAGAFRLGTSQDVILTRDAANTLALRNGVNAQTFNVYNTFTDASNYETGSFGWVANVYTIATANAGTGSTRNIRISSANSILLKAGSFDAWTIAGASGNFLATTDNTYDIGASGASRPRNLFLAGNVTSGATISGVYLGTTNTTVSGLATAAGNEGLRRSVTDSTLAYNGTNAGATVVGGGANHVPVYCNGTNWVIG